MNTGITSSRKLTGRAAPASTTTTGTSAFRPPASTVSVVLPSFLGLSVCPVSAATAGSATTNFAVAVTSLVVPWASVT